MEKRVSISFHSLVIFRLSELRGTFHWEQTVKSSILVSVIMQLSLSCSTWGKVSTQKVYAKSVCKKCGNSNAESETQIVQNSAQDFSQAAYWGEARTTSAVQDCWGLPRNPTRVMLLTPLEQQGHRVRLGSKDLALIFKIDSNDSWAHVIFNFSCSEKQQVGEERNNVQPRLSRVKLLPKSSLSVFSNWSLSVCYSTANFTFTCW